MTKQVQTSESFFSVGFDLILTDQKLPYDLYINSSSISDKERFVRIFPAGESLSRGDLQRFKEKYHQLYILEEQRNAYLRSLAKSDNVDDMTKTEIVKDSAIVYLDRLFDDTKEFNTELLWEAISGCRDSVESMVDVIKDYDVHEVQHLIGDLSYHDFYTYDHSINVSMYTIAIFREMKPKAKHEETIMAGLGGLLHDLGKMNIPTRIINNPGKLSDEDFEEIKKHPDYGVELLGEKKEEYEMPGIDFEVIRRVVNEHHENYNGTGYPNGLEGEDIHIMARIVAVADFFDALTTKRSYHEVLSVEEALEVMNRSVGKKIDPKVFEIFSRGVSKLVLKGKGTQELPDDFDPCRPHNVLPFQKVEIQKKAENIFADREKPNYGSVKSDFEDGKNKKDKKNDKGAA